MQVHVAIPSLTQGPLKPLTGIVQAPQCNNKAATFTTLSDDMGPDLP